MQQQHNPLPPDEENDSFELELDGRLYLVGPPHPDADATKAVRWIRRSLSSPTPSPASSASDAPPGPVVGRVLLNKGEPLRIETVLDRMELDPEGFGGDFVREVVDASPILVDPPPRCAREALAAESLAEDLSREGVAVRPGAVSPERLRRWRRAVLRSEGGWEESGQDAGVRTDVVRFASRRRSKAGSDRDSNRVGDGERGTASAEIEALDFLERVVSMATKGSTSVLRGGGGAGRDGSMSLWRPPQGMIAHYLASRRAHYTWHYDNERTASGRWRNYRTLTAILYLNDADWDVERDGGGLQVRLLLDAKSTRGRIDVSRESADESTATTRTISPIGGTVVLFDSCRIRHRVCPSRRDRLAVTQWFVSPTLGAEDDSAPVGWKLEKPRDVPLRKRKMLGDGSENYCRVFQSSSDSENNSNRQSEKEASGDVACKGEGATSPKPIAPANERAGFSFGFFPSDVK